MMLEILDIGVQEAAGSSESSGLAVGGWVLIKGWGRGSKLDVCLGCGGVKGPGVRSLV